MILSFIYGVTGGLLVIAFIAAIGGITVAKRSDRDACAKGYCESWRHQACGSGLCAYHCDLYCDGRCIDPRPVPRRKPGHRPTVIKGGAA